MANISVTSQGNSVPVNGTPDDDVITTNANPAFEQSSDINFDVVNAGAGDDIVRTGVGNDEVFGGEGNDTIRAGGGLDFAFGGEGNDKLIGEGGNDRLFGGEGNDKVYGGVGNDRLDGGEGNDRIVGGVGSDLLRGGDGDDVMFGDVAGDNNNDNEGSADFFVFDADDGTDRVLDFEEDLDKIVLEGVGTAHFSFDANTGNTVMTYGATTVTFFDSFVDSDDIFLGTVEDIFPL